MRVTKANRHQRLSLTRTFFARGPLSLMLVSNVTDCPVRSCSNTDPSTIDSRRRTCSWPSLPAMNPLLRRDPLVIEPYNGAIRELEIRHDEADARNQLAGMVLDLRHDPSRLRPTAHLVGKALVPDERLLDACSAGRVLRPNQKSGIRGHGHRLP
jgi:hypothetical protein